MPTSASCGARGHALTDHQLSSLCTALKSVPATSANDPVTVKAAARGAIRPRIGIRSPRIETSAVLLEALTLYRSNGWLEVPPFNDEPFADHWFEKELT